MSRLYLQFPKDFDESRTYPAVVYARPISSCKNQTAIKTLEAIAAQRTAEANEAEPFFGTYMLVNEEGQGKGRS